MARRTRNREANTTLTRKPQLIRPWAPLEGVDDKYEHDGGE